MAKPKAAVSRIDEELGTYKAANSSKAGHLPFFVVWFERWQQDCRARMLARRVKEQEAGSVPAQPRHFSGSTSSSG